MAGYRYFIPLVNIAPPAGFFLREELRLDAVAALLDVAETALLVERRAFAGGAEVGSTRGRLSLRAGEWTGDGRLYELGGADDDAWARGESIGFVETHISLDGPGSFASPFVPPSYKVYWGQGRKTFFSDNALKYGNTVVIHQIRAFGQWVEGYPLAVVDRDADIDESIVLINPFSRAATVRIELPDIDAAAKLRVAAQSGRRVSIAGLIGDRRGWRGQVLVSGRTRVITMFAKHSLADPCRITTLEHSEPYRGEPTHLPATRRLRQVIGDALAGVQT